MKCVQDPETGQAILPAFYDLASVTFADEAFLWHTHWFVPTADLVVTGSRFYTHINLKVKRKLEEQEGLFLIIDNAQNNSYNLFVRLRTLIQTVT